VFFAGLAAWLIGGLKMKINSEDSMGTCPKCGKAVAIQVELATDEVRYHGRCPEHGHFTRLRDRMDMADLGKQISSTVGIKGQQHSV
jgi:predicted RNA-binding Zn-ribbon protein involved in translation (DUF1610 family)